MAGVLSFDLSLSASGWCYAAGKICGYGLLLGKYKDTQRLIYNRGIVCDKVDQIKPDLVIFEELAWSRNESFAKENAGLAHMVRAELYVDKVPWVVATANQLKKFACGSGGSKKNPVKKEHVLKFCATRFGHDVSSNDVADAIILAYIGMALMGDWEPTTQAQKEVLAKIRESNPGIGSVVQPRQEETPSEVW